MKRILLLFSAFVISYVSFSHNGPGHVYGTGSTARPLVAPFTGQPGVQFIENKGQVTDQDQNSRSDVQFMVRAANGLNIFVGGGAIHYQFSKSITAPAQVHNLDAESRNEAVGHAFADTKRNLLKNMSRIDVELIGANKSARVITGAALPYYENYLTAFSGAKGVTARSFDRIIYKDVYPHIDWVLYSRGAELEYEFMVRPGGNINNIQIRYGGCENICLDAKGRLIAKGPLGSITEKAPYTYRADGSKVNSHFVLNGNVLSYDVARHSGKVVIDPGVAWATYYGGSGEESCGPVATDVAGNVYLAGETGSSSAIVTSGAYQGVYGGGSYDCLLVKFNSAGVRQWATYLGGAGDDFLEAITTDATGNVYGAGITNSTSGIASSGAFQGTYGGGTYDAILVKFNSAGMEKWATYYGGTSSDFAYGVAADASGSVYMGGQTKSTTGIATAGAYQDTIGDGVGVYGDAILVKFDSMGARIWGTYYGGGDYDYGKAVATDNAGNVYLAGMTASLSGIASPGAYETTHGGGSYDAFLTKFNSTGVWQWGTYYGGNGDDEIDALATDPLGNVYVGGNTSSTTRIASGGSYNAYNSGGASDGFIAKLNSAGLRIWGTFYGDVGDDYINAITVDDTGNVYFAGVTNSGSGLSTGGAIQSVYAGGGDDACAGKFDSSGANLVWATYYGGSGNDQSYGIARDAAGDVYFAGQTTSTAGIATSGTFQPAFAGGTTSGDGFLVKLISNSSTNVKSVNAVGGHAIAVYPNPASDRFFIDAVTAGSLTISTITGGEIGSYQLSSGKTEIALPAGIATGTYICRFTGANGKTETVQLLHEL